MDSIELQLIIRALAEWRNALIAENKPTEDLDELLIMKTMIDRFGEDVKTLAYDMTSFKLIVEVSASPTFFGWIFGFEGKVQILGPENIKEQYKQMIIKAISDN